LQDPIEVRVLPNSIEIISNNGVDPSLKQSDFDKGIIRARSYRNRRIGEFLKELNLTEGRGTGIPTMKRVLRENGSAKPKFDADEPERRYFISEILIHSEFIEDEKLDNKIGGPIGGNLTDRQKEVLEFFLIDNKLTKRKLANKLNINISAAQAHIDNLKEKGVLVRVGGTRGYWEVKN